MEWSLLLLAGSGLFLAGVVKGATGLGYSSCALPFLVSALGLKPAMALVLIPAMATNVSVACTAGHFGEISRRFAGLYLAMLPGIAVGICLLVWINQAIAVQALGIIIIAYVCLTVFRPQVIISGTLERALKVPTGFLNGVLTGLTGSQVMPLFPYMMSLNLDPNRMVQAINIAVLLASLLLAVGLMMAGIMTTNLLFISVLALGPALLGCELGNRARKLIPVAQFKSVVLAVLFATGALLVLR
jgi:uncharacterized membrane protein YfcA